jgi:hypothetical protein
MSALDIHLIFPPQWSPFQPFLSTPSLKAYLQGNGYSVRQSEFDDYRNHALVSLGILKDFDEKERLAKRLLRRECLDDVEDFYKSVTAFKRLLHAFSVAEPIVDVGTSSLSTSNVLASFASIDAFCLNEEDNPFLQFYRDKVASITEVPRYFGISVIGTEQILSSLTLGAVLKQRFPAVPILIGGSVFSRLVDRTDSIRRLFGRYFDLIVRYEGERPLEQVLAADNPFDPSISGITYVEGERVMSTGPGLQLSMDEIPTPDFSDLSLDKYYTPEVVLPILSTRGCYWDKCAFCYHGMIYGDRYRMRRPEALLDDVETCTVAMASLTSPSTMKRSRPSCSRSSLKYFPRENSFLPAFTSSRNISSWSTTPACTA